MDAVQSPFHCSSTSRDPSAPAAFVQSLVHTTRDFGRQSFTNSCFSPAHFYYVSLTFRVSFYISGREKGVHNAKSLNFSLLTRFHVVALNFDSLLPFLDSPPARSLWTRGYTPDPYILGRIDPSLPRSCTTSPTPARPI